MYVRGYAYVYIYADMCMCVSYHLTPKQLISTRYTHLTRYDVLNNVLVNILQLKQTFLGFYLTCKLSRSPVVTNDSMWLKFLNR